MSVKQVFNTSAELDYPTVLPTLDLDFANSKTLDPRITFTRASGGSYVGADGLIKLAGVNEARFDHDQNTGESLGLLVEESRTNLLLRSEEFDNGSWTKTRSSVTANSTIAPDGTTTAEKLIEDTSTTTDHFINLDASGSTSATYTASIFIKSAERYRIRFQIIAAGAVGNRASAWFDSNTGSVVSTLAEGNGSVITTSIQQYPNGWYRCILTGIPSTAGSGTAVNFNVTLNTTSTNTVYTGDGTSGLYLWGAQLEAGAFPTSYIPTVASTRTRAADNASMTGKNFSEWYRQDEGTIYADTKINGVQTTRYDRLWAITNANLNLEGISIAISGPGGNTYIFAISVTNSAIEQIGDNTTETAFTTPRLKSVFAIKQNNCAGAANGPQRFVDSTVDLSLFTTPVDRLLIGQPQRFQGTSCMTISSFTYYPKRLTNSQLQTLTR